MCDREELRQLWLCQKTIYQMMKDRGHIVADSDLEMGLEEFKNAYPSLVMTGNKHALSMLFQHSTQPGKQLFVFFPDSAYFKAKDVKVYISTLGKQNIHNGIIVCKDTLKAHSLKALDEARKEYNLELFYIRELLFNVSRHQDVPQHILLSEEEKQVVLKERKVSEAQLKKIAADDPVNRYYAGKRGQMYRIIRNSETAGVAVEYRVVE
ncbi:DNA-directed RNA polymerases I, II, and III subunit RPABC1 [Nematocida homosporus]|uniref:DNA-directed RNA polymerases I, II, and III subunit RPABC1 n=1 Tax=Nematocida homosporus TaxID=1912981 RepID=UPI002220B30C|nr:DNA-directed RNA polymerases I, II, and III subunit RPABC1 [Nematocida homosporus]KAI5185725.1 DNA-directed RNA polymerases I, II, and III subunit RPABC1 [Nematocida homosporus]